MPSALSIDLRERVVAAMAEGASCHGAAARFGVSASSASRWAGRLRLEGRVAPRPRGGDQRSRTIEAHADLIRATYEAQRTICLHELCAALAEQGVTTSTSGLSRFFARHRITRKRGRSTRPSRSGQT
jgi:transposase